MARLEQLSYYPQLAARVLSLHQDGHSCLEIARRLNAEGWRPTKRRATLNGSMVASLLARKKTRYADTDAARGPVAGSRS